MRNDLTGRKFGRWTALMFAGGRKSRWTCRCDCGIVKDVLTHHLTMHATASCGCLHSELASARKKTHGRTETVEYLAWLRIKQRCLNPKHDGYPYYGGRGITICDEWRDDFEKFFRHIGLRPSPKHSVERIDNERNYEPGNVRWATHQEQVNNTRSNHRLSVNGETLTIAQWSRRTGLMRGTIYARIKRGWSPEQAVTHQLI